LLEVAHRRRRAGGEVKTRVERYIAHAFLAAIPLTLGVLCLGTISWEMTLRIISALICFFVVASVMEHAATQKSPAAPRSRYTTAKAITQINSGDLVWIDTETHTAARMGSEEAVQ
jgi:hypothetical protein